MTKIIVSFLTVLLMFFPDSVTLKGIYQDLTYPGEKVITERIIEAVKNDDVEAIEEMMSPYSSENVENLSEKIKTVTDAIEGNIKNAYWYSGSSDSVKKDYDSYESSRTWVIKFETDISNYKLHVTWIRANTAKPEMVGLDALSVSDMDYNLLAELSND